MVHDVGVNQHLLKVHTDCVPETGHVDNSAVRIGLHLVPHTGLSCVNISYPKKIYSSAEEWYPPPINRNTLYSHAACGIPVVGPPSELLRYLQNTGLTCAHYQRAISSFHRARIPGFLSDPLCKSYLLIAHPFDYRSHASLLYKFLH